MSTLFQAKKPSKAQFRAYLKNSRAGWVRFGEAISEVRQSVVEIVQSRQLFQRHEPIAAALSYGLKHNLITLEAAADAGWYRVMPTQAGMVEIQRLSERTCAFSGKVAK